VVIQPPLLEVSLEMIGLIIAPSTSTLARTALFDPHIIALWLQNDCQFPLFLTKLMDCIEQWLKMIKRTSSTANDNAVYVIVLTLTVHATRPCDILIQNDGLMH